MEYRLLGASGLEVSVLSFGTMTLGGEGRFAAMGNVQTEEARRQIEICIEAGVNLFDTADIYSFGKSEEVLGQALGARRKDIVLATKVFVRLEPGTIAADMQAKLLRVIQEKEFIPLGPTDPVRVDVRILAATNDDLKKRVDEGTFREDLYYRLNVINIVLPPLRERKEDIPALVSHFFTKYCRENEKYLDPQANSVLTFQPEVMQILMEHNWPGNVRELENAVERAVVLATDPAVPLDVLPDHLLQSSGI